MITAMTNTTQRKLIIVDVPSALSWRGIDIGNRIASAKMIAQNICPVGVFAIQSGSEFYAKIASSAHGNRVLNYQGEREMALTRTIMAVMNPIMVSSIITAVNVAHLRP